MTTVRTLVPRPRPGLARTEPGWETRALCGQARSDGLDLTELTADAEDAAQTLFGPGDIGQYVVETRAGTVVRDLDADLAAARSLCAACPVLDACRDRAITQDSIAGFAGGLTERERQTARETLGITPETLHHAVLVPRQIVIDGQLSQSRRLVLDLSTETRQSGQRSEITAEELVVVAQLAGMGWMVEEIAAELVTVRAHGDGSEVVPWTADRVQCARAILSGSRGADTRRPA